MITLVLYIGSLPNLTTWFPCVRGRTLFILGSLPLYCLIIYIDGRILWCTHFLLLQYLCQARKVSGHVFVCYGYRFCLFRKRKEQSMFMECIWLDILSEFKHCNIYQKTSFKNLIKKKKTPHIIEIFDRNNNMNSWGIIIKSGHTSLNRRVHFKYTWIWK